MTTSKDYNVERLTEFLQNIPFRIKLLFFVHASINAIIDHPFLFIWSFVFIVPTYIFTDGQAATWIYCFVGSLSLGFFFWKFVPRYYFLEIVETMKTISEELDREGK